MKSETYHVLPYHEFDDLVNTHLKPAMTYEVVSDQEWNNDENHTFSITEEEYTESDREEVQEFIVADLSFSSPCVFVSPAALLSELAARGIIPWGNYLIEVCW